MCGDLLHYTPYLVVHSLGPFHTIGDTDNIVPSCEGDTYFQAVPAIVVHCTLALNSGYVLHKIAADDKRSVRDILLPFEQPQPTSRSVSVQDYRG